MNDSIEQQPPWYPVNQYETVVVLIRHGESTANAEARFTRHDHEPLTDLGVEQARERGRLLRGAGVRLDALYASPFHRAHHTAEEIARYLGLDVRVDERFYEQSYGDFEGRPYLDWFSQVHHIEGDERWHLAAPGGESLHEVSRRVMPALVEVVERHVGERIGVVSHGGVMASLRGVVQQFERAPESTDNAGGFVLVRDHRRGHFHGPVSL